MPRIKAGPGRPTRKGISLPKLMRLFPDDATAEKWFEGERWPEGRCCPSCGSTNYREISTRKPMPYRCRDCRGYFSVRKGTIMHGSHLGYQTWAIAIYLHVTSPKGYAALRLHRDLEIRYPTAWYLLHRIREVHNTPLGQFADAGPMEYDETFIGGSNKTRHRHKRVKKGELGFWGRSVLVGAKDRKTGFVQARIVENTDRKTLSFFVHDTSSRGATIYTDDHPAYRFARRREHTAVVHSKGNYVTGDAHTNGIESMWALFKRSYHGIYHHMSKKHLQRYVDEFTGKYNLRNLDTLDQMAAIARAMDGKRLPYTHLVDDHPNEPMVAQKPLFG